MLPRARRAVYLAAPTLLAANCAARLAAVYAEAMTVPVASTRPGVAPVSGRWDLHTHTSASDGTVPARELPALAVRAGLAGLAITDHDTLAGFLAIRDGAAPQIPVIPGIELSVSSGGKSFHLLAYLPDVTCPWVEQHCSDLRAARRERLHAMIERLGASDGPAPGLSIDEVSQQVAPGATLGRPHLADALVARGLFTTRAQAFAGPLSHTSPWYIPNRTPDLAQTIEAVISEADGVPVLAHPAARRSRLDTLEPVIRACAEAGLFGLEIDHPEHTFAQRAWLSTIGDELGLHRFGSSDFHGAGKPNRLGEEITATEVVSALIAGREERILGDGINS